MAPLTHQCCPNFYGLYETLDNTELRERNSEFQKNWNDL